MMKTLRGCVLSLLVLVPLLIACDTNGAATAVSTAVPSGAGAAVQATVSALPTMVSGAATAITTAVSGSVSSQDAAYLQSASGLVTQMLNAPELADAASAMRDAGTAAATGSAPDAAALNTKLTKAGTFMQGIAQQAQALQPSANMKTVQDELMKSVGDWNSALATAQKAVGSNNLADIATAATQIGNAAASMITVQSDIAAKRNP